MAQLSRDQFGGSTFLKWKFNSENNLQVKQHNLHCRCSIILHINFVWGHNGGTSPWPSLGTSPGMCCTWLAENIGRKKSPQKSPCGHHRTAVSSYILAIKARIDNRKKNLLSSNMSSTRSHNMVNIDPLAAEISVVVLGTPANFNSFHVLAALLHGSPVVGVSQTLRH